MSEFYVLVCRECRPVLPIPFESAEERGRWAAEHTRGTGHDQWFVKDVRTVSEAAAAATAEV